MTVRSLALSAGLAAGAVLTGCDSAPDLTSPDLTCEDASLSSRGTLTATTPSGSFRATCFDVVVDSDLVRIEALDFDLGASSIDRGIELTVFGTTTGTYVVGDDDRPARARYNATGNASIDAESGTITVTEFSADRIRGSFAFETVNGVAVTEGAFDVEL